VRVAQRLRTFLRVDGNVLAGGVAAHGILRCRPVPVVGSERSALIARPQELLDSRAQLAHREPLGQADPRGCVFDPRDPRHLQRGGPGHAPIVQGAVEHGQAFEPLAEPHPFLGGPYGNPEALAGVVRKAREPEPDVTAGTAQAPQPQGQGAVDRAGDPAHPPELKVEHKRRLEVQEPAPLVAEGDVEHAFREAEGEASSALWGWGAMHGRRHSACPRTIVVAATWTDGEAHDERFPAPTASLVVGRSRGGIGFDRGT